jgi:hypothetical protein
MADDGRRSPVRPARRRSPRRHRRSRTRRAPRPPAALLQQAAAGQRRYQAVRRRRPGQGLRPRARPGPRGLRRPPRRPQDRHLRSGRDPGHPGGAAGQRCHRAPEGRPRQAEQGAAAAHRGAYAAGQRRRHRPHPADCRAGHRQGRRRHVRAVQDRCVGAGHRLWRWRPQPVHDLSAARGCPDKVAGLGAGYLGELDGRQYASLLSRVRALAAQRGEYANRIAILDRLADAAKGEEKRGWRRRWRAPARC